MNTANRTTRPEKQPVAIPLHNGDHLDQKTFHARYEAMPKNLRAELIGGIVYVSSPLKTRHGRLEPRLILWLMEYQVATPGTDVFKNTTHIFGPDSESQPDACLLILPEHGGKTWIDDEDYLCGATELIAEVSDTSESIDLHSKKSDYEKAGVREYLVIAVQSNQVFWFRRRRGKLKEMSADANGNFRSEVFPGLWLDPAALLRRDAKQVLTVLRQGLATPEHAAFVTKLAAKNAKKS